MKAGTNLRAKPGNTKLYVPVHPWDIEVELRLKIGLHQNALKHGRRTFLYSAMGELVCSGQLLGKRGSEAASQSQGRMARAFSSNSLLNTMDMTAAIQYILTAVQSSGSHVYYKSLE